MAKSQLPPSSLCRQELMSWCWQQNPRLRPSFAQILESIKEDMSAAFQQQAFFYSPERKRRSSWEASEAESEGLLEEEELRSLSPPPGALPLGPCREPPQPTNCCQANGKPRL